MPLEQSGNIQNTATLLEHDNVTDGKRVKDVDLAIQIDDVTSALSYIGKAIPGTATSAARWQIKKVDTTAGVIITWAAGNSSFTNIWDNRASLSYS